MTTQDNMATELITLLHQDQPVLYAHPSNSIHCWKSFLHEVPMMWENDEEWFFYNRNVKQTMCGTDAQIQEEFQSLKRQGMSIQDDKKANDLRIYGILGYKNTALRFELSFVRWLGKGGKGTGLCPLLYGIGFMADGLTYIRVKITQVKKPELKGNVQVVLEMN
jgi:hypothetical protein